MVDRLTSDIVRGGFVTVDPSVRRLGRPVARRLMTKSVRPVLSLALKVRHSVPV